MTDNKNCIAIRTGWTFSKAIDNVPDGKYNVIQLRDLQSLGLDGIQYGSLAKTQIAATREIKTLSDDDVLLVAKGPVKTAILLTDIPENTVANQHFFIFTVKDRDKLLPGFLEIYLNSKPVQDWFSKNSGGSYQSTLTKSQLLGLKIPVDLPIEHQKQLVELNSSIKKEKHFYNLLIKQREQELEQFTNFVWDRLNEE
jgi:restriction endonuclease S subunit